MLWRTRFQHFFGDSVFLNANEKSNSAQSQYRAVDQFLSNAARQTLPIDKRAVAAVKICDGNAFTTDSQEAMSSTDLRGRKTQIAVRTSSNDDVVTNRHFLDVGRLILQFKDDLHKHGSDWALIMEAKSDCSNVSLWGEAVKPVSVWYRLSSIRYSQFAPIALLFHRNSGSGGSERFHIARGRAQSRQYYRHTRRRP